MAEHDSDREGREPDEKGVPFDEEAAWAAIVAAYGEEPPDPPGAKPFKSIEDLALPASGPNDAGVAGDRGDTAVKSGDAVKPAEPQEAEGPGDAPVMKPLGGSVSFAPGVGPRDYTTPEPAEDVVDHAGDRRVPRRVRDAGDADADGRRGGRRPRAGCGRLGASCGDPSGVSR